jgi:hypothetical protein
MSGVGRTIAAILVTAILIPVCGAQEKPVASPSPLSEDQLNVYRGFLEKFPLRYRNLSRITVPFDFEGFPDGRPCLSGLELENVSESLRTTHTLGRQITRGMDLRLVDAVEQEKLLWQQAASSGNQKEASNEDGQKANSDLNFLMLSEIVFSTKHQFALLKYLAICGPHCLSGETLVMEKVDGRWKAGSRRPCAMFVGH